MAYGARLSLSGAIGPGQSKLEGELVELPLAQFNPYLAASGYDLKGGALSLASQVQLAPEDVRTNSRIVVAALDLGVPSGRITDILNARRSITADTAVRLGRYFGNRPQFWIDLQGQYDIAVVERDRGEEIAKRVLPADAA